MEDSTAAVQDSGDQNTSAMAPTGDHSNAVSDKPRGQKRSRDTQGRPGRGRGGRNGGDDSKRHKKGDMGRGEYFRLNVDKREKIDAQKRERDPNAPTWGIKYTAEEIEAQDRRPKRKVAVFIGYSGTGYKGMQIMPGEKTIEGELYEAFIKAGAISKANADDPKKASLVRCARTDKGVHAAGNMVSLKLIIEDGDIVEKINAELPPQIRVWGIERTVASFSCYQQCDSRWYEYFIPSYAFLPPWPKSYLGAQITKIAQESGTIDEYNARQEEVKDFWQQAEEKYIKPVLETIDEDIRAEVVKALQSEEEDQAKNSIESDEQGAQSKQKPRGRDDDMDVATMADDEADASVVDSIEPAAADKSDSLVSGDAANEAAEQDSTGAMMSGALPDADPEYVRRLRKAIKLLRNALLAAKRAYRIDEKRIARVQAALDKYKGTVNFHNYTIHKTYRDPSAKRHINSFKVNPEPILIGDGPEAEKSEWLAMKVHGQSFMMHQIRKMVGMVALVVRCGTDLTVMDHTFTDARYSIPKVPGLGLMLERPVFETYNTYTAEKNDRKKLLFDNYDKEIEAFKRSEIYAKMFAEEEERGEFAKFFNHVDNFAGQTFLWVTSKGLEATGDAGRKPGYGEYNYKPTS